MSLDGIKTLLAHSSGSSAQIGVDENGNIIAAHESGSQFVLGSQTSVTSASVIDLEGQTGRFDGRSAQAYGYATQDDGGGGPFVWVDGDVTAANGGTILGAGTGRWRRIYSGCLNPKWFGAVGNGVADDTVAVQAALTLAGGDGGEVHFTAGNYLLDTVTMSSGVTVSADRGAFLLQRTSDTPVLQAVSATRINVKNVSVVATGGGTGGSSSTDVGIHFDDCNVVSVHGCLVVAFSGAGIRTDNGDVIDISDNDVDGTGANVGPGTYGIYFVFNGDKHGHVRVCGNDISRVGQGIIGGSASVTVSHNVIHDLIDPLAEHGTYIGAEDLTAVGNVVKNVLNGGMKFYPYTTTRDAGRFTIVGNTIDGGAGRTWVALTHYRVGDCIFTGGVLYRNEADGTSQNPGPPAWPVGLGNAVGDGTCIWRNIGTSALGVGSGIEFNGTSDFTHYANGYLIASNIVANMTGYGIAGSYRIHGLKIRGNDVKDCGGSGIYTNAIDVTHVDISGNTLVRCATTAPHAILVNPTTGSEVDIRDNVIDGATAQGGASYNIAVANCDQLRISRNRMIGAAGAQALTVSACTAVVVQRNLSDNATVTGVTTTGLDANSWDGGEAGQLTRLAVLGVGSYTPGNPGTSTPSVANGVRYLYIANTGATTITNFTSGAEGQELTLVFGDANTTVNRDHAVLAGGASFISAQYSTLKLVLRSSVWHEVCRTTTNA